MNSELLTSGRSGTDYASKTVVNSDSCLLVDGTKQIDVTPQGSANHPQPDS